MVRSGGSQLRIVTSSLLYQTRQEAALGRSVDGGDRISHPRNGRVPVLPWTRREGQSMNHTRTRCGRGGREREEGTGASTPGQCRSRRYYQPQTRHTQSVPTLVLRVSRPQTLRSGARCALARRGCFCVCSRWSLPLLLSAVSRSLQLPTAAGCGAGGLLRKQL